MKRRGCFNAAVASELLLMRVGRSWTIRKLVLARAALGLTCRLRLIGGRRVEAVCIP
jgi:hypothetical protein